MGISRFKIIYPDIPWRAVEITGTNPAVGFARANMFYGGSGVVWKRATADTNSQFTFDMGAGNTETTNYCLVRGLDSAVAQSGGEANVTLEVRASTDNFSGSNVLIASQNPVQLIGTRNQDVLISYATSAAYRYWRVSLTTTVSHFHQIRKIFLGNTFNFGGIDPHYPYIPSYTPNENPFISASGTLFKSSRGRKQRLYSFRWRNVPDIERARFEQFIMEKKDDSPVAFAYENTGSLHDPLSGAKVVVGWIVETEIESGENYGLNNISIRLIEDIV